MIRINQFCLCLLVALVPLLAVGASPKILQSSYDTPGKSLKELTDKYFDFYFKTNPTAGTEAGFHEYDDRLEDYSQVAIKKAISRYSSFESQLKKIRIANLSLESNVDYETLKNHIRTQILQLQSIRNWEKDPDFYTSLASKSLSDLISRSFASSEKRMASVIEREKRLPEFFAAATRNISNPPKLFVEMALSQIDGTLQFFKSDIPTALKGVHDSALQLEFRRVHKKALQALDKYKAHLVQILPQANGDYRLGAENFSKLLLYKEGIETPLQELLVLGHRNLAENQKLFNETLAALKAQKAKGKPHITEAEVFDQYSKDHPTADQLIAETRLATKGIQDFLKRKSLVTIPTGPAPFIQKTPDFQKELTDASMETPGLFEKKATESYFYVTVPDSSWPAERTEEHLQSFNRPRLKGLAAHELYPGHYLQYLKSKELQSKVRKLLYSEANSEGWAHYCEQMVLDEGYEKGDPSVRLGQLQDALLRNARFIAAIELHAGKMTVKQAIDFFETEGKQSHATAEREALRGTSDPTYLTYTLGKIQILQLRDDYKQSKGSSYSIKQFHDEFLTHGPLTVPLVRKLMLLEKPPHRPLLDCVQETSAVVPPSTEKLLKDLPDSL
jgi:uncharacterized protein (DUF885 family)